MQWAAWETNTKAVILPGTLHPRPTIRGGAAEMGALSSGGKPAPRGRGESIRIFCGRTRLQQPRKLERFRELMTERMDLDGLFADLGLG